MNLIVGVMLILTGLMFLAYTPFFKKELKAKIESNSIGPMHAEKELKKMKLGGIGMSLGGIIVVLFDTIK